jgi:hypothetical protein
MSRALVEKIKARCIEDGGCLIWQGPTTPAGMPWMKHEGNSKAMVRRVLYEAQHGSIAPGLLVSPTCGHKQCLACLEAMTPAASKAIAAARGAYRSQARVRRRVATMRARSKYTEDVIASIRLAASAKEAQEQTGASLPYVYAIRAGAARADLTTPFAGLGARASTERRAA